jgi:hypothetical protein
MSGVRLPSPAPSISITYKHHSENGGSIGAIAIPDEVCRGAVPWKRFRNLPRQPSRRGVLRYVEMKQPSPGVAKHDEGIKQPERGGGDDKQVDRGEALRMVRNESPPGLRRWARVAHHVSGHRRLGDVDAELEKLTVDPRCSPERVLSWLIRRIRSLTSTAIRGRPRRRGLGFHLQNSRKPLRCQRMTVSGLTMSAASRQRGHSRLSHTQKRRSALVSRGREVCRRSSTPS